MSNAKIKRGFNFLSKYYDILLLLGSANILIRSQVALIPFLNKPQHVLLLGDGTGNFLKNLLLKSNPENIVYIDISEGMVLQAKKKIKNIYTQTKIDFRIGSFELISKDEKFDLIVTNYFLDLFPESELVKKLLIIHDHLDKKGILYVTDFDSNFNGMRKMFYPLIKLLYIFFGILCGIQSKKLPEIFAALSKLEMKEVKSKKFFFGLLKSGMYEKL